MHIALYNNTLSRNYKRGTAKITVQCARRPLSKLENENELIYATQKNIFLTFFKKRRFLFAILKESYILTEKAI